MVISKYDALDGLSISGRLSSDAKSTRSAQIFFSVGLKIVRAPLLHSEAD